GPAGHTATTALTPHPAGTYTIKAVYSGDSDFPTSTGTLTQIVNQDATTTSLASSAAPSLFGQAVSFTATIAAVAPGAGTPGGTVQFQINGNNFGSPVTLAGATATSTATTTLSASSYTIKAVYSGDGKFTASTGMLTQIVNEYAITTNLAYSAAPSL